MMSLFSLTINKTGEIKCIQLTSVAYEPNLTWGKRQKWYAIKIIQGSPIKIYFWKERHWRNRPKDNSTYNFGLIYGGQGNHMNFLKNKRFPWLVLEFESPDKRGCGQGLCDLSTQHHSGSSETEGWISKINWISSYQWVLQGVSRRQQQVNIHESYQFLLKLIEEISKLK